MQTDGLREIAAAGGFVEVTCCGKSLGFSNPRPFTLIAARRFEEIRQSHVTADDPHGNGWATDREAKALIEDPAAHEAPDDGARLPFACGACGASFVWAGGEIQRVARETS